MRRAAEQPGLELLVRAYSGRIHNVVSVPVRTVGAIAAGAWRGTGDESAVVAPVEADPWSALPTVDIAGEWSG